MSRNKAIWLARLLFRRGQLTKDEILDAWGRCDENARRMAPSTFYDNRHLLEERFGIKLKCESGYYSLDLRDGKERDFMKQLFRYDDTAHDSAPAIYIDEQLPAGYRHVAAITEAMERRLCSKRNTNRSTNRDIPLRLHPTACGRSGGGVTWWDYRSGTTEYALSHSTALRGHALRNTRSGRIAISVRHGILQTVSGLTAEWT